MMAKAMAISSARAARDMDVEPATLRFDDHAPAFLAATVAVSRAVVFRAAAFRSAAAVIAARISR